MTSFESLFLKLRLQSLLPPVGQVAPVKGWGVGSVLGLGLGLGLMLMLGFGLVLFFGRFRKKFLGHARNLCLR